MRAELERDHRQDKVTGEDYTDEVRNIEETLAGRTALRRAARAWASQWSAESPGLFVWGEVGAGKTFGVIAALREVVISLKPRDGRLPRIRYVDVGQLLEAMKGHMGHGDEPRDLLAPLETAAVLVLDEVGASTEWEVKQLTALIGARYNAKRTTHFISNHAPGVLGEALDSVAELAGRRLVDRMKEMSARVEVTGMSRRRFAELQQLKKKKA